MNTTNESLRSKISHIRLDLLHFGHAIVGREWTGSCVNPAFSRLYYILSGSAVLVGYEVKLLTKFFGAKRDRILGRAGIR